MQIDEMNARLIPLNKGDKWEAAAVKGCTHMIGGSRLKGIRYLLEKYKS